MPAALYLPSLEEVQIGVEAVWGDAAAQTIGMAGITNVKMTPKIEASHIPTKMASTVPGYLAVINKLSGEATVDGIVTYTQFKEWLNAMFAVDAATPFAYIAALAPAAPQSLNLMYGQSGLCYGMAGALADSLTIRGDNNGPLTFSEHFVGKAPVALARVALTPPAVLVAQGGTTVLSIDPIATAHGTTPLALTAFSFEALMTNSRSVVWHMANMNPDNYKHGVWGGSLKLVLEMTAATKAYLTAALANTTEPSGYNVRLVTTGTGTAALTFDWSGHLLKTPEMFTDKDGVTTCELELDAAYSSQAAQLTCYKLSLVAS